MFSIQQFITGRTWKRHLFFAVAILSVFSLGICLFYAGGFNFNDPRQVVQNCLFFIAYLYSGRWLCAYYYLKGRLLTFVIISLLLSLALLVIDFLFIKFFLGYPNAGFLELMYGVTPFFAVGLITGMLLKLIRVSMEKELKEVQARVEQRESEFGLLQAQLSPHFLFNVLNNLYGISITNQERVPKLLLQLSQLLRYSVYGARKALVPLKEEVDYISNFVAFQQIGMSDRLVLEMNLANINDTRIKIAPLVLIVFVENAFKHARSAGSQKIYICLSLRSSNDFICLEISNSYQQGPGETGLDEENTGVGLANTIKRLDLLYGKDYTLKQYARDNQYFVELKLKAKYA
ncbi:MAG TPA: histidine kinase [Chitinophagaceae bacterium]|nr:histidine kinase [Chitinophagaceae bacterium]